MSVNMTYSSSLERVGYLQCKFCNTILAVSVPCNSMMTLVTVRCGHCANLLSISIGSLFQSLPLQDPQKQLRQQQSNNEDGSNIKSSGSSSSSTNYHRFSAISTMPQDDHPRTTTVRPPEKRQRVPSAYNRFIKEEIQRIKASNPDISHREAFSTAAKNWAHFPHIHFGLKLDGNKQP